jgi:accessory colonization factor AcfC
VQIKRIAASHKKCRLRCMNADAWITYESWGYRLPDTTDLITVKEKFKVYRGTPIAITNSTDQRETAEAFLQFLRTPEVHAIFIKWGWR